MTRRIVALLIALVFAVIGTTAVVLYVRRADDRALAGTTAVEVLVAKQRIPAGTTGAHIREEGLAEALRVPASSVPQGQQVLTNLPPELDKLVVTSDVQAGYPLFRPMFSQSTRTSGGLAIPDGKLAVSFDATVAGQVAGYVRPGSQVAVFAHYRQEKGNLRSAGGGKGDELTGTAVLLPKVEVIAIGAYGADGETTTTSRDGQVQADGRPAKTVLVTVAVGTLDAARLIHAMEGDALWLALVTDSSDVHSGEGVDSRDWLPPR